MGFSGSIEQVKLNAVLGTKTALTLQKFLDLTITSNTTLSSNLSVVGNITINSGITLTTNGYSIICSDTLTNNGTITGGPGGTGPNYYVNGVFIQADNLIAGTISNGGGPTSDYGYGASGGGCILLAYGSGGYTAGTYNVSGGTGNNGEGTPSGTIYAGGNGGSTYVGTGGTGSTSAGGNASNNSNTPTLSNSLISSWYANGINNYLAGASGGAPGSTSAGANGTSFPNSYGGGGGAGGGGSSATANYAGGSSTSGQVLVYNYGTTPPISIFDGITSSCPVLTTGKIQVVLQGIKLGSTLDSSVIQISVKNTTTNSTYNFIVASGQTFYYSFIDSQNIVVGQNYQYEISASTISGTPSTAFYYSVEAREVL